MNWVNSAVSFIVTVCQYPQRVDAQKPPLAQIRGAIKYQLETTAIFTEGEEQQPAATRL